jgi:hypothetical protein
MKRTTKQQQTGAPVGRATSRLEARPGREIEVRFFEAGREVSVEEFLAAVAEATPRAPRWRLTEAGRRALEGAA